VQAVCRRPVNAELEFDPRPVFPGFVVDEVARGQIFFIDSFVFLIAVIPAMLHTRLSPTPRAMGEIFSFFPKPSDRLWRPQWVLGSFPTGNPVGV
jgi:hypothetical protein